LCAEADAGRVEEVVIVDLAHVDAQQFTGADHLAGPGEIGRNS
jgi:hypothetical protein